MKKILLLLILCIIVFLFMNNQSCSTENFTNICWSLQSSYRDDILNQNKKLITSLGLGDYINYIIEPFLKSELIDKKITLEKYLTNVKIPANKITSAINLINTILNNNCMISSLVEYAIKGTTPLIDIVATWYMDNLRNNMLCIINDKTVIDDLIKQLVFVIVSPKIELCNNDKFLKYCESSHQNYLKEIAPKIQVITVPKTETKVVAKTETKVVAKTETKVVPKTETKVVPKTECGLVTRSGNCTANYNPVLCSDGKIYSNSCKASLAGCSNCSSNKVVPKEAKAKATGVKVTVVNKKELEKFTQELDKTKKEIQTGSMQILNMESKLLPFVSNSPKYMDVNSLSKYLQSFNVKSFGSSLEPNMIKLMSVFKTNNKKDFNIMDKKEFGKLVVILVDEIKLIINNIVDEDDFSKLKPFINEFNNFQKIFYLLKHNYKLLLAYELIDNKIKRDDEKLQAQLCCTKSGEKSCFNFSANPKNSSAIIYGFNELGYVNTIKCVKEDEDSKKLVKEQSMTIDELFSNKYASWKNLAKENKVKILASVVNLFSIYGIKLNKIDSKIYDLRKQMEENKNKITMSDLSLKIPIKPGNINEKFVVNNNEFKKIVEQIKNADKIDKLHEIIKLLGFTNDQILFNTSVDLAYTKAITETLALIIEVFKNFEYDNNSLVVAKLFGIVRTQETFTQIMSKTSILPRYHQLVVDFILKTITNKKFAIVRSYTMNSIPETIIQYLNSKPSGKDLDLCNIYEEFLIQLRKDRLISNSDFNEYNQQNYFYCNPSKVKIQEITSAKIPINDKKGLAIVDRKHNSYNEFINEHKEIVKNNLKSSVVSDNILFNLMKNTYN